MKTAVGEIGYRIACQAHPDFGTDPSVDFALCYVDQPLPVTRIERIDPTEPIAGAKIQLVGYGCRNRHSQNFDGAISEGEATVQPPFQTPSLGLDTLVVGAVACSGDSGGAAFLISGSTRTLAGVISRSDGNTQTWIATTAKESFLGWAREWSQDADVTICGIANETSACIPREPPTAGTAVPPSPGLIVLASPAFSRAVVADRTPGSSNEQQLRQVAYRPGDRLIDIVLLTCAAAEEGFLNRTLNYLAGKNQQFDRDHRFTVSGTLVIPMCPPNSLQETMDWEVKEGESRSLWFYFQRLSEDQRLGGLWTFERPANDPDSPKGLSSRYYVEVFLAMNVNQTDANTLKPGKITLPLRRPGAPFTLTVANDATEAYEPILQGTDISCPQKQNDLTYPFDVFGLLNVLAGNRQFRPSRETGASRVAVLDSGLFTSDGRARVFGEDALYFTDPTMAVPRKPEAAVPRLPDPMDAVHGTWVASTVLGGPLFAMVQSASTGKPRIRIDPYNLYQALPPPQKKVIVPAEQFRNFLNEIVNNATSRTVINLSIKSTKQLDSLRDRLGIDKPNFLFVVAAGNGISNVGQRLNSESEPQASFPAANGAAGQNLITVAALYRDQQGIWRRAPFSDYNPQIVEIGAPGCSVPVLHYDDGLWDVRRANGSSFAAPLVSFAAALIASEINFPALEIKQRILAASDLNPHLTHCITDGRSLNVVKALSMYHDVIELRPSSPPDDGNAAEAIDCRPGADTGPPPKALPRGELVRGTIQFRKVSSGSVLSWNQPFPVDCGLDEPTSQPLKSILKIVPSFNTEARSPIAGIYPDRIYVERFADKRPQALNCKLPNDVTVWFSPDGRAATTQYSWTDLRDVVPRIPRQRH